MFEIRLPPHAMSHRLFSVLSFVLLALNPAQGQTPDEPLTLVSRDARRPLPTVSFDGLQMVAIRELALSFGLTVADDQQPGRLILTRGDQVVVLTADEGLVSVSGRLVSLASPPREHEGTWYVPVDFIGRTLPLLYDETVDLRRRSGLVVLGDIRVPQVVGRYQRTESQQRLRFMISPATPHVIEQEQNQLLIQFEADALDLVLPALVTNDLVAGLRGIDNAPALAVDLHETFGSFSATSEAAIGGATELVIDIRPKPTTARAAPSPIPVAPRPTDPAVDPDLPALADLAPPRTIRTIAIDPGHGGDDVGTRGPNGTLEKEVTLDVARRLQTRIESELGLRVILTRTTDSTVALDERAAIANNNRADLFISLHTNASVRETATGAEVFYLSLAEYSEEARRTADGGQPVPTVGGGARTLDIVPWEMAQLQHVYDSVRWAETVADELSLRLPMSPRGLQRAPFRVLVGANMPAVVVEMGFISNPDQETQLLSATFQNAIVNGLLRSIIRYSEEVARGIPLVGPPAPITAERPPPQRRLQ